MISRKFLTSSAIYTISSALPTGASFLLLPFYTNTKLLSLSDFGALPLYIGISLLIQVLVGLSLDFYVGVTYHELKDAPEQLKEKIASLNGYILLLGLITAIAMAISGTFFIHQFVPDANPNSFRYLMMSVFTGIFNAHFKFYNALLINKEKPWTYFWSNILNFVTTIGFSLIILEKFPLTLEGPLWGRVLSGAAIFGWSFIDISVRYGIRFKQKFLKPVLKFCGPLLITAAFQWVLSYADRYIIKSLFINEEVAIFDLAVRFTVLISFTLDGLSSAIVPKLFSLLKEEQTPTVKKEINKYYSSFNLLALIIIPVNILLLPVLLPVFINNHKYLQAFMYFGIISSGLVLRSIQNIFVFPIHFKKQTSRLIWINGISAIAQVIISFSLIYYFKLYGGAFALNLVRVFQTILFWWIASKLITPGLNYGKMLHLPFIVLIIISVGEIFITGYGMRMHLIHLVELVATFIVTWFFYKNELYDLWAWGKRKLPVF